MAVTKIWNIKDSLVRVVDYAMNPEKTTGSTILQHDLTQVLDYAENADKTDHFCYVTGINCIPEAAAQQMTMTKLRFGKTGGNVAFHAYQSFRPGEVSADQCHQIGVELARKLWGDRFEVVVATHLNTGCLHNHFVLNSVSFADGKRYNDCKATYREFRRLSDEICREHGLSVIENPQKSKVSRSLYLAEKAGLPTRYNLMRRDIDNTLSRSFTERFFYQELQRMGYLVRYDSKRRYNTLQIPGTKHPTRFKTLGEDYTEEAIRRRILQNRAPSRPLPPPPKNRLLTAGKGSFRGLYLHYCYLLGVIQKNPHPHYSTALRAETRKLDEYSQQAKLICREQIDTADQLQAFIEKTQEQIPALVGERERVYKQISRCKDENLLPDLVHHRDSLTEALSKLRKDLRNAKAVMERSEIISDRVNALAGKSREKEYDMQK